MALDITTAIGVSLVSVLLGGGAVELWERKDEISNYIAQRQPNEQEKIISDVDQRAKVTKRRKAEEAALEKLRDNLETYAQCIADNAKEEARHFQLQLDKAGIPPRQPNNCWEIREALDQRVREELRGQLEAINTNSDGE